MALKIRLRQQGRNNRPSYRLVVTDVRAKRDGEYVEALGWYDPFIADPTLGMVFKEDRILHWLNVGAELTQNAESLVAKSCPTVIKQYKAKLLAQRTKERDKRKARRQKAEG